MTQYIMTYLGGDKPSTAEEGKQHFAKYQKWLSSMGDTAVSPANPFKQTQSVDPTGNVSEGSNIGMSGYTIIDVETMDDALNIAKRCPFLEIGGTLEVSELMKMPS